MVAYNSSFLVRDSSVSYVYYNVSIVPYFDE